MDVPSQVQVNFETQSHTPPFNGVSRSDVLDGSESVEPQNAQESSSAAARWHSTNLASGVEDANPSYPYLPTVLEEPGSSFSEGNFC